jgi:outer membrane protein, multidrug efflux system
MVRMMRNNFDFTWAAAMSLCLWFAGCSVGPDYKEPALAVPGGWSETPQEGASAQPAELVEWWKEFKDPALDALILRAAESNLDLRIAEARLREARAALGAAGADFWPTVDLSGSYTRNRVSENAVGSPGQGGVVAPAGERQLEQNLFRTGFDAGWEIDVFGGIRRRIDAAQANLGASVEERRGVFITLLGDVAKNYIDLRGNQRRFAVARANLELQRETLRLTKIRFDAGLASDLEVAQAEGQSAATAAQIPVLESALKQTAYALDVLVAAHPGTVSGELAKEAPIPALPPDARVGLPAELLRRRPDIRRAERQLAAATAQVGAATADLYPKFSLLGSFGLQSISAGDWFTAQSRFWSIGPTVRWPIFDAGRIRANIEIRTAQQEQALGHYEKSVLTALQEVESALATYGNEQIRYRSLVAAVAANRRAVETANDLYIQGLLPFLNVLDAQRNLNVAESDLVQSEANMASNLVVLYKALGGGWEAD